MSMDKELYEVAAGYIRDRFPDDEPFVGAASARTASGRVLVSTGLFDVPNDAARLCHETGVICDAYKSDDPIVALICLSRDESGQLDILAPCGICQERLFVWGGGVQIAVPKQSNTTEWEVLSLDELQPHYWFGPYESGA